ncbi:glycoprotein xg [Willisornis vidua]|uniref:Glycoprotein xg n=1 Tax=Willisornis vidua TaxID=1566151 RepID=A0ABQ9DJQ1_9PASS|nr:glycoprotein xg [Willisornis vidua]
MQKRLLQRKQENSAARAESHSLPIQNMDNVIILCKSAFQVLSPQHVLVNRVVPPQNFPLLLELHEFPVCPVLQDVQVPLNGSTDTWCISHSYQFYIICKLVEGAHDFIIQVINEELNSTGTSVSRSWTPLVTGLQMDEVVLITTL